LKPSDLWRTAAPLALAAVIWLLPHAGFSPQSWRLLCLFAATVSALITRPLPAGAVVLISITVATLLRVITIQDALGGFANVTVWLIVAAFLFALGVGDAGVLQSTLIVRREFGGKAVEAIPAFLHDPSSLQAP